MAGKLGFISRHAPHADPAFHQLQRIRAGIALRIFTRSAGHAANPHIRSRRNIRCPADHGASHGAPTAKAGIVNV